MRYPVSNISLWYDAQPFGTKTGYGYHEAADLNLKAGGNSDMGQEILAIADGEVTSVHLHTNGFGKHLHIKHEGPWGIVWSHYAHCDDIYINIGQKVAEGQLIARVGKTGTEVAHLHFAIKLQPTGIDAVAKTQADLTKWTNPLAFIEKWKTQAPQPENDPLKECLKDRENFWQQRDEALKQVQELQHDNTLLRESLKQAEEDRDTYKAQRDRVKKEAEEFKQSLSKTFGIDGFVDEERIKIKSESLVLVESELISFKNHVDQERNQHKQELEDKKTEIETLRTDIERMQEALSKMETRLNTLSTELETKKQELEETKKTMGWINKVLGFFKR